MLKDSRHGFRLFLDSAPGRRFADLYARRRKMEGSRLNPLKLLNIAFGIALILAGVFFLAIPGPGITMIVIGCVLLGGESRLMAGVLDRVELLFRRWWPTLQSTWWHLPAVARWLVILLALMVAVVLTWLSALAFLALDPLRFFRGANSP